MVSRIKSDEEVSVAYMKSWELEYFYRQEGRQEGLEEGRAEEREKRLAAEEKVAELEKQIQDLKTTLAAKEKNPEQRLACDP